MANCQNSMRYSRQNQMRSPYIYNQNHMNRSTPTSGRAENSCCPGHSHAPVDTMPIAMAYVPWQEWQNIYEPCKGFSRGTIFEDLDKPFYGRGGCNR